MNDALLTPITPAYKADLGRKPHRRYRIIRSRFEAIVKARDELKLSNRQAARSLGLRGAKEFEEAYELLKRNGEAIIMNNDWTGVEHVLYARFPHYQRDPMFHALLDEFKDPRPREQAAPVLPVPIAPMPASDPSAGDSSVVGGPESRETARPETPPPVVPRFGKPTARNPLIVAAERAKDTKTAAVN